MTSELVLDLVLYREIDGPCTKILKKLLEIYHGRKYFDTNIDRLKIWWFPKQSVDFKGLSSRLYWEDDYLYYLHFKNISTDKKIAVLSNKKSGFLASQMGHWQQSLFWQFW